MNAKLEKAVLKMFEYVIQQRYGKTSEEMYAEFLIKGTAFGKQYVVDEDGFPSWPKDIL